MIFLTKFLLPFIPLVGAQSLFHGQKGIVDIKNDKDVFFSSFFNELPGVSCDIGQVRCVFIHGLNGIVRTPRVLGGGTGGQKKCCQQA